MRCDLCRSRPGSGTPVQFAPQKRAQREPPARAKSKRSRQVRIEVLLASGSQNCKPMWTPHRPRTVAAATVISEEEVAVADLDKLRTVSFKVHKMCSL